MTNQDKRTLAVFEQFKKITKNKRCITNREMSDGGIPRGRVDVAADEDVDLPFRKLYRNRGCGHGHWCVCCCDCLTSHFRRAATVRIVVGRRAAATRWSGKTS
jgi:hypothetical protein